MPIGVFAAKTLYKDDEITIPFNDPTTALIGHDVNCACGRTIDCAMKKQQQRVAQKNKDAMEWENNSEGDDVGEGGGGKLCEVMQNFVPAKHDIRDALCGISSIYFHLCFYLFVYFSQNYLSLILIYGRIYGQASLLHFG